MRLLSTTRIFLTDIFTALRDLAGIATWLAHKFFPNASIIKRALSLPNPCDQDEIELSHDESEGVSGGRLIDMIDVSKLDKQRPYCIHFDLGLRRCRTGVALTKSLGAVQVQRNTASLDPVIMQDNSYQTDLVLAVIPKPGRSVAISKLKNFVLNLGYSGIKICAASADGWESANLLQDLEAVGIPTEVISTVRTRDAFDLLKNCANESRWHGPYHPILEKELLELDDKQYERSRCNTTTLPLRRQANRPLPYCWRINSLQQIPVRRPGVAFHRASRRPSERARSRRYSRQAGQTHGRL